MYIGSFLNGCLVFCDVLGRTSQFC